MAFQSSHAAQSEGFPMFNSAKDLHSSSDATARRRRKSSVLGDDLRVGDTGAPALATTFALLRGPQAKDVSPTKYSSKRRRVRSLLQRAKDLALQHTWALPLLILLVFLSLYALNPSTSNPVHHFIFLSYARPPTDDGRPVQYGKGPWDVAFVVFYTIALSFSREFIMQELLRPLARYAGLRSRGKQARFMEQMYTALYFGILGPTGMYVMSRTPMWYFNTRGFYVDLPHHTHEAVFKFYYLLQAAYWAQQVIVLILGMEKPRKDFKELIAHHIVSVSLIAMSYRFHFTHIGLAVYITHDISDFFLATSKTLNYIDSVFMAPYYLTFTGVWIYMRHYLNLHILYSIATEFRTIGPWELDWEAGQFKSQLAQVIALSLLGTLQALNFFWLFFIIRIGYRFAILKVAKDERSDDEESDVNEDKSSSAPPTAAPLPRNRTVHASALAEVPVGTTRLTATGASTSRAER